MLRLNAHSDLHFFLPPLIVGSVPETRLQGASTHPVTCSAPHLRAHEGYGAGGHSAQQTLPGFPKRR